MIEDIVPNTRLSNVQNISHPELPLRTHLLHSVYIHIYIRGEDAEQTKSAWRVGYPFPVGFLGSKGVCWLDYSFLDQCGVFTQETEKTVLQCLQANTVGVLAGT